MLGGCRSGPRTKGIFCDFRALVLFLRHCTRISRCHLLHSCSSYSCRVSCLFLSSKHRLIPNISIRLVFKIVPVLGFSLPAPIPLTPALTSDINTVIAWNASLGALKLNFDASNTYYLACVNSPSWNPCCIPAFLQPLCEPFYSPSRKVFILSPTSNSIDQLNTSGFFTM